MKTELQIKKRRDLLKLQAQEISSQIDVVEQKLKVIPEGLSYEHLRKSLIQQLEGLHISLGMVNGR